MSVNFDRKKGDNTFTQKEYKIKVIYGQDPYWDECVNLYPRWNDRYEDNWKRRKQLYSYQIRMYKTWKHNRKTQYKSN